MILPASYNFSKAEWPWKNFKPEEMACRHCGENYFWPEFLDRLQKLRTRAGRPINLKSGHRCALHNARIGGAIFSQHLKIAVDIDLKGHDRKALATLAKDCGFLGQGYYRNFLHLDLGGKRHWFGNGAKALWV